MFDFGTLSNQITDTRLLGKLQEFELHAIAYLKPSIMEGYTTTTIHMTPHQFKEYIPTPDDFDSVYTEERVRHIAEAFRCHLAAVRSGADSRPGEGTEDSGIDSAIEVKPLEETVSTAWVRPSSSLS